MGPSEEGAGGGSGDAGEPSGPGGPGDPKAARWTAAKEAAGERGAALVEDGQAVGLGSGSTAAAMVRALARRVDREGLDVVGVPTSRATARLAEELGIPLADLEDHPALDVALDGADEVDPRFHLVKGLGGALVREKIVAHAADRFVVLVDARKLVDRLGTRSPLPVEVVRFGHRAVARWLTEVTGADPALRTGGQGGGVLETDNGNVIYDLRFDAGIASPEKLAAELSSLPGVVDHGLFLDMATDVVVGRADGRTELRRRV